MGFHKRGDEKSRSASVCLLEIEVERELRRMTQREKDDELHRVRCEHTCSLFVACTSCSTRKVGTSCMNTVKLSCHGGLRRRNSGDDR